MSASGMIERLALLALAGAAGTLARAGVYAVCQRTPIDQLPAATLIVNVVGSFLFGVIWPLAEREAGPVSPNLRWLALAGFMGAFTTFSTFAFETGRYLQDGRPGAAALNLLANNLLGIGAFLSGWWISQKF